MKKTFLPLMALALFLSTQAFAQNAERLLTADIMSSKKTLKTDVKIYNYFYMEKIWPGLETEAKRREYAAEYLALGAGSFWNPDFHNASTTDRASGGGIYFAIDPLISKKYGNMFVELKIPAGTTFINVVSPIALKKETISALITEGYIVKEDIPELFPKRSGFYRDTLRAMVLPEYTNFRGLVQNIFSANNIQFVEYNFNTSLSVFCAKHSYSAFVFVGSKNVRDPKNAALSPEFSNIDFYSTELAIPRQSETEVAQQSAIVKFRTLLSDIADMLATKKMITKDFISSRYATEEVKALKAQSFSCE